RRGLISDHSPSVNSSNFTKSPQIMIICYEDDECKCFEMGSSKKVLKISLSLSVISQVRTLSCRGQLIVPERKINKVIVASYRKTILERNV
ncbi:MAG: hypothetical protein SVM80_05795, partial [Halobacteriota archaeon]|nr:hypothetical protein [Halobacteriota archaeon]